MAEPFVGEIRLFAGNFAPVGWAFCSGQLLPISEYTALFSLIGTTYGGDGQATFRLPDLRGRSPLHVGSGFVLGQTSGSETVTLSVSQLPSHSHPAAAAISGNSASPVGNVWSTAPSGATALYNSAAGAAGSAAQLNSGALSSAGGGQAHDNMQPFLTINFIIALFGVFPPIN